MNNASPLIGRLGPPTNPLKRPRSPNAHDDASAAGDAASDKDVNSIQERRQKLMRDVYARSERMIAKVFDGSLRSVHQGTELCNSSEAPEPSAISQNPAIAPQPTKRAARHIEEDDYGDSDDEETVAAVDKSKLHGDKQLQVNGVSAGEQGTYNDGITNESTKEQSRSPEDVRKRLEEEKKSAEDAAIRSFLTTIYTLENDRDAMLEQQKLDDLDRQIETETSGQGHSDANNGQGQGTLSNANMGASSLALKHLIALIDKNRRKVTGTDSEIQSLMSAVRKNRSKWASEEKVGQEELYEAAEGVLVNLKAQTEHSTPFLAKVNKRDAPDYYKVITKPMDIGTMLKKLKNTEYKSKKDFMNDLELIWANCLKYNADPHHPLRKKAEHMRKETARLGVLIPDIVVRDRAEIEAEEKREARRNNSATLDDSDDDDRPISAMRARKGNKGGSSARKAPPTAAQDANESPAPEPSSASQTHTLAASNVKIDQLRSDLDSLVDGSQNGLATPPVGNHTPLGAGSLLDGGAAGSHADASEIEVVHTSVNGVVATDASEEIAEEDEEYRVWKQVTKRDRARMSAERHRLFRGDRLNAEESALLRSKAGMRRWIRQQKKLLGDDASTDLSATYEPKDGADPSAAQTLAEGIDSDGDCTLPDYYYPLSGVPAVSERLRWTEDAEGYVIDRREDCLRMVPRGHFTAPPSNLVSKMDANMRQMQETRKIMNKIGMVKQMQLQTQTYQNQFQKYEPEPFQEADIEPMFVSDDGPVMPPAVGRAALQRSIAKLFYHAGFEDYQPSALDTITDVTADYMHRLTSTLLTYHNHAKVNPAVAESLIDPTAVNQNPADSPVPVINQWQPRFTSEEAILHMLQRNGQDLDALTSYVEEDVPRAGQKLAAQHEAARQYYQELLRPVLDPALVSKDGGAGAFNDGNETQFVQGDFAEEVGVDFFGFSELGLDKEFNFDSFRVPFDLLQARYNNHRQVAAGANVTSNTENTLQEPPRWLPVTEQSIEDEIELVKNFFKEKLEKNNGAPLTEDEDLPAKQRFPKPRLPPTGKISSPRKRPIREQQMMARKKKKLENEAERERERQEQGGNWPNGINGDQPIAGARASTNLSAPDAADVSGTATADGGTGANSEETSRRASLVPNSTGQMPNGVLTNGDVDHETPTTANGPGPALPKPVDTLKLDKPEEDRTVNTDPEKRSKAPENTEQMRSRDHNKDGEGTLLNNESVPIAAH